MSTVFAVQGGALVSGPKCATYEVDAAQNELLRRARLKQARHAAEVSAQELGNALAAVRRAETRINETIALGSTGSEQHPGADASSESLERFVESARRAIATIGAAVQRAEALHALRRQAIEDLNTFSKADVAPSSIADWSEHLAAMERSAAAEAGQARAANADAVAARHMERIEGKLAETELDALRAVVAEMRLAGDASRLSALETQLRSVVQRANDRLREQRREATEAARLLTELRGFETQAASEARAELEAIVAGAQRLSPALVERVAAARRDGERRINERYVGEVMTEELQRLGYDVGDSFVTLFAEGGVAIIPAKDSDGYGVEFQVDRQRGMVDLAVVNIDAAAGSIGRQRLDIEAETRWCHDFDALQVGMTRRGIRSRMVRKLPPGAQLVKARQAKESAKRRPAAPNAQRTL